MAALRTALLLGCSAALLTGMAPSPAAAESLRCTGGIADEGDSRVAVLYKCGQPKLVDSFCAPVYYNGYVVPPTPEPLGLPLVPCQRVDEWLYDRGPGNLLATVRFRSGSVSSITFSREPR